MSSGYLAEEGGPLEWDGATFLGAQPAGLVEGGSQEEAYLAVL